jgi:hypothetical protein
MFYALDRGTGKVHWEVNVPHQMVVLEQFQELPFLLFTARYQKGAGAGNQRFPQNGMVVKSYDKRNGKLLYDPQDIINGTQFYALTRDPREGRVDFTSYSLRVSFYLGEMK